MELTKGIVCILDSYKRPTGTGFVVSTTTENLIITCAHVLGEPRPKQATIIFQPTGEFREARVINQWWRSQKAEDVAILQVVGDLPQQVQPLLLGTAAGTRGHTIHTFGFPNAGEVKGIHGFGEVLGLEAKTEARQPLLQLRSSEITQGFSGAPVWDEQRKRVIGMIAIVAKTDAIGKLGETAFAIPIETLLAVCPVLTVSEVCPYRNLDAFTEADARFFFGRARVVDELIASLLAEPRFLAVFGPSGSGKSSVVRAGLIPLLLQGKVLGNERWIVKICRPAGYPFDQLSLGWDQSKQGRLMLVIDQFEELFSTDTEELCKEVATHLTRLLESSLPITVVLVMRDDFYSRFVQNKMLEKWLRRGLVNVSPILERDELVAIVREPARILGLGFEDGLVETIVKNAMENVTLQTKRQIGHSTILPLLEFALTRLWDRRQDGLFTHKAYHAIGGVTGSLTQWADQAYYSLEERLRPLARRIFIDLVYLGDESQQIPNSRRRRSLTSLHHSEDEQRNIERVVGQLVDARLLVTSRDEQNNQETVEIIHDALLREWGVLRQWVEEDRRFLTWHQELERSFQAWIKTDSHDFSRRDRDKLLRGHDLLEAEDWLESHSTTLSRDEMNFIEVSREQQMQEEQRWKELYEKSEHQRQIFSANYLANQAELIRDQQTHKLQLSMLLAVESIQRHPSPKANQLLREGMALLPLPIAHLTYDKRARSVNLSPDGRLLTVASGGNCVEVHSMPNGYKIAQLEHDDIVHESAFSRDGHLLATASSDRTVSIWSTQGDKIAQLEHDHKVLTVAFSSDDRFLATTSLDYTARLWDIRDMQELVRFVHRNGVTATFSPDSRYLAVGSDWVGEALTLFQISNRQCIPLVPVFWLRTELNHVDALLFSPDGRYLVIILNSGDVVVWDVSRNVDLPILLHEGYALAATFSPNGKYLATSSDSGMVEVWRASGKNAFGKFPKVRMKHNDRVEVVMFNSDSTLLATASDDQTARVWEVSSGKQLLSVAHEGPVSSVIFSQDGRYFVTASDDCTVRIWDINSTSQPICLTHDGPVSALSFNSDGNLIATASDDQTTKIWQAQSGTQVACLHHEGKVRSIAFNPTDNTVATASRDGTTRIWNARSGSEIACLPYKDEVWKVIFSTSGRYFATSGKDQTARIWKATDKRLIAGLLLNGVIEDITFSSDGRYLALTSGNALRVLDIHTGRQIFSPLNFFGGRSVSFSPNGRYLAAASGSRVKIWDMATGDEMSSLKHDSTVCAISFSPDGRYLGAASEDWTARVWDSNDGHQIAQFTHKGLVWAIAFSPEGSYLATASWDCTACVWEVISDRQIACFTHEDKVFAVAFSPDGKYLATASEDHTARIWLWRPTDIVSEICSRLTRNLTPEEWQQYLGNELYCKTCPNLP